MVRFCMGRDQIVLLHQHKHIFTQTKRFERLNDPKLQEQEENPKMQRVGQDEKDRTPMAKYLQRTGKMQPRDGWAPLPLDKSQVPSDGP